MATKTFRTIYLNKQLDRRLMKQAEREQSSVSRIVRLALEKHLKENGFPGIEDAERIHVPRAMEV